MEMSVVNYVFNKEKIIIIAAIFLGVLGFISLNIYLPAIPAIAISFKTNPNSLKFSITLFLTGFALSQFYWGSLSAKRGRKAAIFYGLIIANIGTFLAFISINLLMFNCARLVEGVGIGTASVMCRALLTDSLDKTRLSKYMSLIVSIANIIPALAPLIGGYLVVFFSWRTVFLVLFIYTSVLGFLIQRFIHETNGSVNKYFTFKDALGEYIQVFTNRSYLGYVLPYLFLSGGMIAYYAAAPFIFVTHLHIAVQDYSYLLIATVSMYVVGAGCSGMLRNKVGFNGSILYGIIISLITAILLLFLSLWSKLSVTTAILPFMLYMLACGIVSPNANACALSELKHIAGASAAVIAASVYAASALITMFITELDLGKLSSLAIYVAVISLFAITSFYLLILRHVQVGNNGNSVNN